MGKVKRGKEMLSLLLGMPQGITGEVLAKRLNVSSRTIRSDIKEIQKALQGSGAGIESSPNKGYRLVGNLSYDELLSVLDGATSSGLNNGTGRRDYIIEKLIECKLDDVSITQMDLAEEMYLGISTLKSYLPVVREYLSEYEQEIELYRQEGIRIKGEEQSFRYMVVDFLLRVRNSHLFDKIAQSVSFESIDRILSEVLNMRGIQLTDVARENLRVHMALSISRERAANCCSTVAQKLEETFEYVVAKEIVGSIYRDMGIDLPHSEVYYITQCLRVSKKLSDADVAGSVDKELVKRLINKILAVVNKNFGIDFSGDQYLIDGLALHLQIAVARIEFRMNIRNELLQTIKRDYPLAFQMGVLAAKVAREEECIAFNDNEIGYIALHFGAALSRSNIRSYDLPKRVICVCSAGLGISILLKAKIEERFTRRLIVERVLPAYKLDAEAIHSVDFILSAVKLPEEIVAIAPEKIVRINHMLRDEDIAKINKVIFDRTIVDVSAVEALFDRENFYAGYKFKTKDECIEFITSKAVERGIMTERSKASVFEREQMSSTSIGDFAAVPHPLISDGEKSHVSILLLDTPVTWDDLPVSAVFLLHIDSNDSTLWENIFRKLYEYIKSKEGIASLLDHKSYDVFLDEFLSMFK